MKITNEQIINFANMRAKGRHFPVRLMYALTMNANILAPAIKAYTDSREELIKKHSKKDEDGAPVVNEQGNYEFEDIAAWNKEIKELLDADSEVPVTTIPMSVIEKCEDSAFDDLSFEDIDAIKFMIEE